MMWDELHPKEQAAFPALLPRDRPPPVKLLRERGYWFGQVVKTYCGRELRYPHWSCLMEGSGWRAYLKVRWASWLASWTVHPQLGIRWRIRQVTHTEAVLMLARYQHTGEW